MSLNAPLTYADAQTELATITSQGGNFTFSSDELTSALTQAWNDTYNVTPAHGTISYVAGTNTYAIPSPVTVVRKLEYQRTTSDKPEEIMPDLYEVDNEGNIIFTNQMTRWLYDTYTITVRGSQKLTTSDSLPTTNHVNYVLNLAAETLLSRLLLKKTFVFLTNDTSTQEIIAALNTYQGQVLRYKQALLRQFESA